MRNLTSDSTQGFTTEQKEIFKKIDFNKAYLESNILFEQYKFKLFGGDKKVDKLHYMHKYQNKKKFIKDQLAEFESQIHGRFANVWLEVEPHSKEDYYEFYDELLFSECISLQIYQENLLLILDHFANELLIKGFEELTSLLTLNYVGCSIDNLQLLNSKEE